MKFGKEFSSQMVPEWYETYMDYAYMKTLIKDIHQHNKSKTKTNNNKSSTAPQTLSRNLTLYRSFSGLTTRNNNYYKMPRDLENPAILVKQNGDDLVSYETEFLLANEDGGEYELVFFKRLDDEFNKVDKFYRSKVVEVLNEAEILNKQMDALIAFRIKVENPHVGFDRSSELTRLASDVAASTAALAASTPSSARSRNAAIDVVCNPLGKSGGASIPQFMILSFGSLANSNPYLEGIHMVIVLVWLAAAKSLDIQFTAPRREELEKEMEIAAVKIPVLGQNQKDIGNDSASGGSLFNRAMGSRSTNKKIQLERVYVHCYVLRYL